MENILRVLRYLSLPLFLAALLLAYAVSSERVPLFLGVSLDKARFFYTALGIFIALQLLFQLLYALSVTMNKRQDPMLEKHTWTLKAFFHTFILSANLFCTCILLYLSFFRITSQHMLFYSVLYLPLAIMLCAAIGVLYRMFKSFFTQWPHTPPGDT